LRGVTPQASQIKQGVEVEETYKLIYK